MVKRKGMGKGTGKGYKNMIPIDKKVHSDSAKGRKQPQKEPNVIPYRTKNNNKKFWDLNSNEIDLLKEYAKDDLNDVLKKTDEIISVTEESYGLAIDSDNGQFFLFSDYNNAESFARESGVDALETDESLRSSFEDNVFVTDTDKRIMANEEADYYESDMDDDEVVEQYGDEDKYNEIQDKIDELSTEQSELDLDTRKGVQKDDILTEAIEKWEEEKEQLIDEAREEAREKIYDEWYDGLDDPISFLVDKKGMYSKEDLLNASFISFDYDEAVDSWVRNDGWDVVVGADDYNELPNGAILWNRGY